MCVCEGLGEGCSHALERYAFTVALIRRHWHAMEMPSWCCCSVALARPVRLLHAARAPLAHRGGAARTLSVIMRRVRASALCRGRQLDERPPSGRRQSGRAPDGRHGVSALRQPRKTCPLGGRSTPCPRHPGSQEALAAAQSAPVPWRRRRTHGGARTARVQPPPSRRQRGRGGGQRARRLGPAW